MHHVLNRSLIAVGGRIEGARPLTPACGAAVYRLQLNRHSGHMIDDQSLPIPSRESAESWQIALRPVKEIASEAIVDIDHAVRRLRQWGIKIPEGGRLAQARAVLDHAARTGAIVPVQRGDDLGLRALEFAFDYAAIAETLPPKKAAAVRRELENSLTGDLDPPEESRGPLQLQSQFVVRAALVRAGLSPEHPIHAARLGIKNPDFVLQNGLSEYGVEVKRPKTTAGILPRFEDGRAQLQGYGLAGAVLIDVTDCVRGVPSAQIDAEVRRLALLLYDRTFVSGRGYHPGSDCIRVAGTFARVGWHSDDGPGNAMVNVHTSSTLGVFATAKGTLLDHRGKWLRKSFEDGLGRLYQTLAETSHQRGPDMG